MDKSDNHEKLHQLQGKISQLVTHIDHADLQEDAEALAEDAEALAEDAKKLALDLKLHAGVETEPLIGTVIDNRYEIVELIGTGGMGSVYRARHTLMGKMAAVKVLLRKYALEQPSRERFLREAKATSNMSHPNLVSVWDFGFLPTGEPFIAMDFIPGESLQRIVEKHGPLDWRRAVPIFSQICDGLAHAHAHHVVHRDLKPSNVLITRTEKGTDHVTILDFGLAKIIDTGDKQQQLTQTGEVYGSPPYMSPEQCMGNKLDGRSDIYSLGCLMYEALTGNPAFLGDNALQTMYMHTSEAPPSFPDASDVPDALKQAVTRCLDRNPERRFQTATELGLYLDALLGGHPVVVAQEPKRQMPKLGLVSWLALFVVLAACAVAAGFRPPLP